MTTTSNTHMKCRSNPPSGFLRRLPASELQLGVSIHRYSLTTSGSPGPIERSIDDPKQLIPLIHLKTFLDDSRRSKSIFDHEGVIVNQRYRMSEYIPPHLRSCETETQHDKYRSYQRHSRSLSREIYRKHPSPDHQKPSMSRKRSRLPRRSPSPRRGQYRARSPRYGDDPKGRRWRSPSKPDKDVDSRGREMSPGYKSPEKRRSRSPTKYETEQRSRSRSPNRHPNRSRDRRSHPRYSRSLSRDRYRKHPSPDHQKPSTSRKPSRSPRRSPSPRRTVYWARSPRYSDSPKGRRSRSPSKPDYVDRRGREKSPGYKSPEKRRSRSPTKYETERRSRSSSSSSNRHPNRSRDRSRSRDHRRSNRSPAYERDRSYKSDKHRRSRSRSPRKHRNPSPHGDQSGADFAFYEGVPGSKFGIHCRISGAAIIFSPIGNPMWVPVYNSKYKRRAKPKMQSGDDASSTSGVGNNPSTSTGNTGEAGGTRERQDTEVHKDEDGEKRNTDEDGEKRNTDEDSADNLHEKDWFLV